MKPWTSLRSQSGEPWGCSGSLSPSREPCGRSGSPVAVQGALRPSREPWAMHAQWACPEYQNVYPILHEFGSESWHWKLKTPNFVVKAGHDKIQNSQFCRFWWISGHDFEILFWKTGRSFLKSTRSFNKSKCRGGLFFIWTGSFLLPCEKIGQLLCIWTNIRSIPYLGYTL